MTLYSEVIVNRLKDDELICVAYNSCVAVLCYETNQYYMLVRLKLIVMSSTLNYFKLLRFIFLKISVPGFLQLWFNIPSEILMNSYYEIVSFILLLDSVLLYISIQILYFKDNSTLRSLASIFLTYYSH